MLFALACASLLIAIAADLLTVVIFTITISTTFFLQRISDIPNSQTVYLLWVLAALAAIAATGTLGLGIFIRRRAMQRSRTSYATRIAAIGIRFSFPAVVAWGTILCAFVFVGVMSGGHL